MILFSALYFSLMAPQFDPPGLSAKSRAYHQYRLAQTEPTFELAKVKKLIATLHAPKDQDFGTLALPKKTFDALSIPAKFTYCMIYGEVFSQNCDGMPAVLGEETKIFAEPSGAFGEEEDWSPRQVKFLHTKRAAVVGLLRKTIREQDRVGVNLKKAILELRAYELIPELVSVFEKTKKDLDILSVLSVLMKDGHYRAYTNSVTFRRLYRKSDSSYKSFTPATPANEKLMLDRAMEFYKIVMG